MEFSNGYSVVSDLRHLCFYKKQDWIDNPLEYARVYLDGTMQIWIDAEDFLEVW